MERIMIDWTKLTHDSLDEIVRSKVLKYLISIRRKLPQNNYDLFLEKIVRKKRVLDIGLCEHTKQRMNSPAWKHNIIQNKRSLHSWH